VLLDEVDKELERKRSANDTLAWPNAVC